MKILGPIHGLTHQPLTLADSALASKDPIRLELPGTTAYPGFVNAHDHLDFNLFPGLRVQTQYDDWLTWGLENQRVHATLIRRVMAVPQEMRMELGRLKCLLHGITTVIHHGPERVANTMELSQWRDYQYLHSARPDGRWHRRPLLGNPKRPIMVHINEGTSQAAKKEYAYLQRWNVRRAPILGVHGIGLRPREAQKLQALLWCPGSNQYLYGTSPSHALLQAGQPVLLGSDSTISGAWSWFEHLRAAHEYGPWSPDQLLTLLFETPYQVLAGLGKAALAAEQPADLVVLEGHHQVPGQHLLASDAANVLLVLKAGRIVLFDDQLLPQIPKDHQQAFVAVASEGRKKWVTERFGPMLKALQPFQGEVPHLPSLWS